MTKPHPDQITPGDGDGLRKAREFIAAWNGSTDLPLMLVKFADATLSDFFATRDAAEGALLVPDDEAAERMTADRLRETAAPPKPAPDPDTVQTLLDLLNPLHGELDRQTYDAKVAMDFDMPSDYAHDDISITAQMERDLTQAVLILEDRKRSAPVPPADGPARKALEHAKVRFACLADHFREIGDDALLAMSEVDGDRMDKGLAALPSGAGAAEQGKRWYVGAQNDGLFIVNAEPCSSNDHPWHDNPSGPTVALNVTELPLAKAQKVVDVMNALATPLVRGDREAIAQCRNVINDFLSHCDDRGDPETRGKIAAALEIERAILSLRVQPGAGERE